MLIHLITRCFIDTGRSSRPTGTVPGLSAHTTRPDLALLRHYLGPQWRRVLLLGCLLLITIALQLYAPIILGQFIDDARAGAPLNGLYIMALSFIGLIAVAQLFSVMTSYQAEIVGWTATNALRSDLTRHILKLDLSFHNRYSAGELIERVDGDVGTLHQFFALLVVRIIGNALLLAGLLIILFWQDSLIGLGVLAFVFVIAIIFYRIRHLAVEL